MSFVIRDIDSKALFQSRSGRNGWYDHDATYARRYKTREGAQHTIDRGNHHVSYPGNRQLEIIEA
jgi:hypothetical protein